MWNYIKDNELEGMVFGIIFIITVFIPLFFIGLQYSGSSETKQKTFKEKCLDVGGYVAIPVEHEKGREEFVCVDSNALIKLGK